MVLQEAFLGDTSLLSRKSLSGAVFCRSLTHSAEGQRGDMQHDSQRESFNATHGLQETP